MTAERIQVLLVEDNPTDAMLVQDELAYSAPTLFTVVHVEKLQEALTSLGRQRFDVVLLDLSLPDSHGLETFVRLHAAAMELPIIVLSGQADGLLAIQAVQAGAQDYLVKGHLADEVLQRSIRYAIERQRAERTLAESEERYRLLIERSPDAYLVVCDDKIVFANATSLEMFGAKRIEQLVGIPYLRVISAEDHDIVRQGFTSTFSNGSNPTLAIKGLRLDGTTVAMEGRSNSFLHEGRLAVQVVLHDVTERKRSEARFRWLVDSNAQGVMFWNKSGEISDSNDAFLRLVGYSRGEMQAGKVDWAVMTPPEYAPVDNDALEEISRKGFCTPYEKEIIRKDGSRVPILIGAAVFEDSPEEGVCFMLDLTERKKLEQNAIRAQRLESIGTLAGGIAHDLNNSLSPILMVTELMKEQYPDCTEMIDTVERSAQRGADMVRQLLTFSKGIDGKRLPVQSQDLLAEMTKFIAGTFPKSIELRSQTIESLPIVLGDRTQLYQVLLNLCVNARDAMPQGGTLSLTAATATIDAVYAQSVPEAKPGEYVVWRVEDSGTGIAPHVLERIFEPFFSTKDADKGTGLGLSTTIGIVRSHGGFVRVYSVAGKGTTFAVYLPAAGSANSVAPPRAPGVPSFDGNNRTILVVDDDVAVRECFRAVLQSLHFRVVTAADGTSALLLIAECWTELCGVITDLHMPNMDGLAFVRLLRKKLPQVAVLVASGRLDDESIGEFKSLGVNILLDKPFTHATLVEKLNIVFPK